MSECNVCIYFDGDSAEVFEQQNRKARKDYVCSECERPISKGAVYQYCKMLFAGEWSFYRTCLVCAEIRKAFCCEGEMLGGIFWSQMEEYGFPEMNRGCLSKLTTVDAKRYFAQRYREWREARAL